MYCGLQDLGSVFSVILVRFTGGLSSSEAVELSASSKPISTSRESSGDGVSGFSGVSQGAGVCGASGAGVLGWDKKSSGSGNDAFLDPAGGELMARESHGGRMAHLPQMPRAKWRLSDTIDR